MPAFLQPGVQIIFNVLWKSMLTIQNLSYVHPNHDVLFHDLNLVVNAGEKISIVGNNGVGKSTLLKIIAGRLEPSGGEVNHAAAYYIPQIYGQYDDFTIGEALGVHEKLIALNEIVNGNVDEHNYKILGDDWDIEERCNEALREWQLDYKNLHQKLGSLSGGEKLKVFLAGITINHPEIVLLDEPTNHLDIQGRDLLYSFIKDTRLTLVVVSHDRTLLNLIPVTYELTKSGIRAYGGNYDFYFQQKENERNALFEDIRAGEKALRKAREIERETKEREQKRDARGKKKQTKEGMGKGMMDKMKNDAERSTAKIKSVHEGKIGDLSKDLHDLRTSAAGTDKIKIDFDNSKLPRGKILFTAMNINYTYGSEDLWAAPLNFQITCGERIALTGRNGSGKTTLLKIIIGQLKPQIGVASVTSVNSVYIDQEYSLIRNDLTVFQQAQEFNVTGLQEYEIKTRLNRFLFSKEAWDTSCSSLSGGERMRLMLCCLSIRQQSPDLIVLDEPTNNLDIQNIEILTNALVDYQGTLLVISHDAVFLEQIGIERTLMV